MVLCGEKVQENDMRNPHPYGWGLCLKGVLLPCGAANRGRTGTVLLPKDFKSFVSAYSTIAANYLQACFVNLWSFYHLLPDESSNLLR